MKWATLDPSWYIILVRATGATQSFCGLERAGEMDFWVDSSWLVILVNVVVYSDPTGARWC